MNQTRAVEFATGLFILLGLVAMFFLITQTTNISAYGNSDTYDVTAHFRNIGGLKVRAPVSMAGVTIGHVTQIQLDQQKLDAKVTLEIDQRYGAIPSDTSAEILTAGLLGEKYIGLVPGGSPEPLRDGDEIYITQSAVVLENLISKYLFNQAGSSGQGDKQ